MTNIPENHKAYLMAVNIPNDHRIGIPKVYVFKIHPNWDFLYANLAALTWNLNRRKFD
jgi:hypothetical protein